MYAGDDAFRFRHMLIRDAAYDGLPKAIRAELHERFAEWLESHGRDLLEFDEILGYHLEQAYTYRRELGASGEAGAALAERAAGPLARSGRRASARGDAPAAVRLFRRAAALLPAGKLRATEAAAPARRGADRGGLLGRRQGRARPRRRRQRRSIARSGGCAQTRRWGWCTSTFTPTPGQATRRRGRSSSAPSGCSRSSTTRPVSRSRPAPPR